MRPKGTQHEALEPAGSASDPEISVSPSAGRLERMAPLLAGLLVAVAVVAPLAVKGWLLLLDSVSGPYPDLPPQIWGVSGGATSSVPMTLVVLGISRIVGRAPIIWLELAVAFPLAFVGMARLIGASGEPADPAIRNPAGRVTARLGAGALYAINPFVFDRAWAGHLYLLLGYAVVPFAAASLIRAKPELQLGSRHRLGPLTPALWMVLGAAISVHLAWILTLLLLGVVVVDRFRLRTVAWSVVTLVCVAASLIYLFGSLADETGATQVGAFDLQAYATRGDIAENRLLSLLLLTGFWRREAALPVDSLGAGAFFLGGAVLIVMVTGAAVSWRAGGQQRRALLVLGFAAALATLLALGNSGPTGPLFVWLFDHLPGFKVMREAQKFILLLALFYAFCFGHGMAELVRRATTKAVVISFAALAFAVPAIFTPTLFWGFAGRITPSRYPAAWTAADRLMGPGHSQSSAESGKILFLPWHQYNGFNFTGGRNIYQPATAFFRRPVIQGDNPELRGDHTPPGSRQARSSDCRA